MPDQLLNKSILDAVAAGLFVIGPDGYIVHWNAWMASASGCSPDEAKDKSLRQVFPHTKLDAVENAIESAMRSGTSTLLTSALHPDLLPLRTRARNALTHDVMVSSLGEGETRTCLVQVIDVSSSARRERFLRTRQNARYNALVESAPDAIMTVDSEGIIRLANPATSVQFGYRPEALIGQKVAGLFENKEEWSQIWRSALKGGSYIQPPALGLKHKDGTLRYFEVSASRWQDGFRTFVTAILRDVTDRREADAALRESERQSRENARALRKLNKSLKETSEALSTVDRRKDEFLATLAHELRNPLAPLRNGLQLMKLAKGDLGLIERTRHMMELQLGQMVRLIDDLMDVSRISRDMISLTQEMTSLDFVIRQAVETSGPLIDSHQHTLTIDIPHEEIVVNGDSVRLTQVFANLLNNAAKYTPKDGRIGIRVTREGSDAVVRIEDNGIGIPPDMLSKVFVMFTQVDHSLERTGGGLGIGLSLVKRLVEMHGGTVEARSLGRGQGSTFVVRLPTAQRSALIEAGARGASNPQEEAHCRRILIADDNEDSASSLAMIVRMMGHETQTANDGLSALEIAGSFSPHLVLLDIGMPKMNGYETARRIRQEPWGQKMLLVALTGWGQEEDRRQSSVAGFNIHLVKPVDIADIERVLAMMRTRETPAAKS